MAYDFIRWGIGFFIFIILLVISLLTAKKKGKAVLISAFVCIALSAALLLFPIENYFYSFPTAQSAFSYRHHEDYVTSVECNSGVLAVGKDTDGENVYYTLSRTESGYKLVFSDNIIIKSSSHGVFLIADFGKDTVILTKVATAQYSGTSFSSVGNGYYGFAINNGEFSTHELTCLGSSVSLV